MYVNVRYCHPAFFNSTFNHVCKIFCRVDPSFTTFCNKIFPACWCQLKSFPFLCFSQLTETFHVISEDKAFRSQVWSSHLDEVLTLHSGSTRRQPQVSASGKKSQCMCNIVKEPILLFCNIYSKCNKGSGFKKWYKSSDRSVFRNC